MLTPLLQSWEEKKHGIMSAIMVLKEVDRLITSNRRNPYSIELLFLDGFEPERAVRIAFGEAGDFFTE